MHHCFTKIWTVRSGDVQTHEPNQYPAAMISEQTGIFNENMTHDLSFHLPHNTPLNVKEHERAEREEKDRRGGGGGVSEHRQHDMFGPEEVKQRKREAEWERGRARDGGRPATSSLTVH